MTPSEKRETRAEMGEAKRKQRQRTVGMCFWRLEVAPLTLDHVPPKAMFPVRVHASLPNVMACDSCNAEWKKDGDYFRDAMLSGPLAQCTHPDLTEVRAASERGDARLKEQRNRRSLFDTGLSLVMKPLNAPPEITREFTRVYEFFGINQARIADVIGRTISALYANQCLRFKIERQELVPPGYRMYQTDIAANSQYYETGMGIIRASGNRDYGGGLLAFYGQDAVHDPKQKEWLVCLYDTALFYARIALENDPHPYSAMFPGILDKGGPVEQGAPFWYHSVRQTK
jgi:hypothetical protein